MLLQLPTLPKDLSREGIDGDCHEPSPIPASYTKFVTNHMGRVEVVLKLVGTPAAQLVERFRIMWPDGVANDFKAIMAVKGVKKGDQVALLQALGVTGED